MGNYISNFYSVGKNQNQNKNTFVDNYSYNQTNNNTNKKPLDKYIQEFNQNGYVLLKDYFTQKQADNIVDFANELETWDEQAFKWMIYFEKNNNKLKSRLENFLKYYPRLNNFFINNIHPLAEKIYGAPLNLFKEKMNWKNPNGKGFKPHQDQPAWTDFKPDKYVTIAIFANNSTEQNGCLEFGRFLNNIKSTEICEYDKNTTGQLKQEIIDNLIWSKITTTPRDVLIFDSYVPHRSGDNNTTESRRILYFTFNEFKFGNFYDAYLIKKREEFPPDIERINCNKNINIVNNKYNLANPIE